MAIAGVHGVLDRSLSIYTLLYIDTTHHASVSLSVSGSVNSSKHSLRVQLYESEHNRQHSAGSEQHQSSPNNHRHRIRT